MSHTKSKRQSAGFTLIELLMGIILSGVIVTVFVSTLMSMVRTANIQKTQLELSQENQLALSTIERDVRTALAFDTTLAFPKFSDSYGPTNTDNTWSGTWSYKGPDVNDADHRVLILRESATVTNPLKASRTLVHVQGSLENDYAEQNASLNCTAYDSSTAPTGSLAYNATLPYYLIYFVRDSNLYRRTITDTTTPLCNGPQYQKQSCPKADTTPHSNCAAYDELIAENVSSFTASYNRLTPTTGSVTIADIDAYSSSEPDIFEEINNVVVTLRLQKTVSGSTRGTTLSIRVSRVN